MKHHALKGLAVVAAAALTLTACSAGDTGKGGGGSGGNLPLNIGNFLDVTSWDPALADIGFDGPYMSAVYDPLVVVDGEGEPQPALATDWQVSDDYKTITMNLRSDAVFSDGEKFDAAAAVKSLDYLKEGVRSQEAYQNVESFEAIDDDTLAINLTQRDDTILYFMGLGRSYMMAPAAIDDGSLVKAPSGSGPYTLSSASVPGAEYHFDKVADHWDAKAFRFDPLVISPLSDPTAMLNGLEGGQFNVIYGDQTAVEMAEGSGWNVSSGLASWVGLEFTDRAGSTESTKPLGDVRVRQALNYAFNGPDMLQALRQGDGAASNQVFPDGTTGNLPELNGLYKPNIDTAKKLLAEAGYPNGFAMKMPMAPPFQPYQAAAEQVFGDLGLDITWDDYQFADYMSNAATYPMSIGLFAMDSNPVATVERQIAKPQWYNPNTGLDSYPEIKAQSDKVFAADPGAAQDKEIETLNKMVTDEAWFNVWYQANNSYVSTKDFTVTPVTGMMFPTLRHINVAG